MACENKKEWFDLVLRKYERHIRYGLHLEFESEIRIFQLSDSLGELGSTLGLSVGWGSSEAIGLDGEVGGLITHGQVEEAVVAPVGAPRVATDPVLFAGGGILAVTDDGDLVVDLGEFESLSVDVVSLTFNNLVVFGLESVGGLDTARDGAIGMKLSHHLVFTFDRVVVGHIVFPVVDSAAVGISSLTFTWWGAVTAHIVIRAHAVNQVVGSVLLA